MPRKKTIAVVDEVVRTDGPVFMALLRQYGHVNCKDVADTPMKLPVLEVISRFADAPKEATTAEVGRLIEECFYENFPDIRFWVPPDLPKTLPSWLTDRPEGQPLSMARQLQGKLLLESLSNDSPQSRLAVGVGECGDMTKNIEALEPQPACSHEVQKRTAYSENKFALSIFSIWADLGRMIHSVCVPSSPLAGEMHFSEVVTSQLDVPYGFIVPGGRFREMYYWDSYWIIRGLLYSGMVSTARGIILNFAHLVRRFGFIPNGTRSYYQDRSQPPVFSMMLAAYFAFTGDLELIRDTYTAVEDEYLYWLENSNRQVCVRLGGKDHYLCRYLGHKPTPRPESWKDDVLVASFVRDRATRNGTEDPEVACADILRNIRAAAESGWDFSSRWVPDDVDVAKDGVMPNLKTESILPADLNSFLYHTELYLLYFGMVLEQSGANVVLGRRPRDPSFFHQRAEERREAMLRVFWNDELKWWFDFDTAKGVQSTRVTAAGVVPLLMQLHSPVNTQVCRLFGCEQRCCGAHGGAYSFVEKVPANPAEEVLAKNQQLWTVQFLVERSGLWNEWGISTTRCDTGQQWDGSNCWPPLLQMALEAMISLENSTVLDAAKLMVKRHIYSCMQAYNGMGALPEKSNSLYAGSCGSGGEYECQKGFGWSAGVALELLFFKQFSCSRQDILKQRGELGSAAFLRSEITRFHVLV